MYNIHRNEIHISKRAFISSIVSLLPPVCLTPFSMSVAILNFNS